MMQPLATIRNLNVMCRKKRQSYMEWSPTIVLTAIDPVGHIVLTCDYCVAICTFSHRTICLSYSLAAENKSYSKFATFIFVAYLYATLP